MCANTHLFSNGRASGKIPIEIQLHYVYNALLQSAVHSLMVPMSTLNERLRHARQKAGYNTATQAIDLFGWKSSTYRAHENGQNNYGVEEAKAYAKAYGVTPSWLLIGDTKDTSQSSTGKSKATRSHKHNCVDVIYATALLLKDDRDNLELIAKLDECVQSLKSKLKI